MQYFDPFHLTAEKPGVTKKAQVLQKKPYTGFRGNKKAYSPQMVRESVQTLRSSGYKVFPPNDLPQPYTDVVSVNQAINFNTGITQILYGGGGVQFKNISSYWTPQIHSLFDPLWNIENPTDFKMDIDVLSIHFTGQFNVNNPYVENGPEIYFENSDELLPWFDQSYSISTGYGADIEYSAFSPTQLHRYYSIALDPVQRFSKNLDIDKKEYTNILPLKRIHFEGLQDYVNLKNKNWAAFNNPYFYAIYEEDTEAAYLPMNFSNSYCLCNINGMVEFQYQ